MLEYRHHCRMMYTSVFLVRKASGYDQEIPQARTADQPTVRAEELENTNNPKTSEKQFK